MNMDILQENKPKEIVPKEKQPQYQKFRGWTIKILSDLEHSSGKTSRAISTGTFGSCKVISVILCRLRRYNLVEKVANWGWKITRDGLFVLGINNKTTDNEQYNNNNKDTNTIYNNNEQNTKTKNETTNESAPTCFKSTLCHIKRLLKKSVYNLTTMATCDGCVMGNNNDYPKFSLSRQKVGISI